MMTRIQICQIMMRRRTKIRIKMMTKMETKTITVAEDEDAPVIMTKTITEPAPDASLSLPQILLVVGPTASGKTALALALASHSNGIIISADSRQCYREMAIGSAAPTADEMQGIPHRMVTDRSVHEHLSAGQFEREALQYIAEGMATGQQIIVCGGAGLFLKALVQGLDDLGNEDPSIRTYWMQRYRKEGLAALQQEILRRDPDYAAQTDMNNHQRLLRALEIMDSRGQRLSDLRTQSAKDRPFRCCWIGINPERSRLHETINMRVDQMVSQGLEQEAAALYPWDTVKACQSPGYVEWEGYWNGSIDHATCVEHIKQHTRQFARRQLTWFRRNHDIHWIPSEITQNPSRLEWVLRNLPIR
ncbi:MAG: tRNA (adenosine(37)-N6)-dimethylallyltransferase MiaA [Sphingomonadales bacterium]|nr:tRNA (adenosine(37)-N6)-dimethylallyltransferase MiaA [Sphingomonadales bacterium]